MGKVCDQFAELSQIPAQSAQLAVQKMPRIPLTSLLVAANQRISLE